MKYMLMMHAPGRQPWQIMSWPPERLRAHIDFMRDLNKGLRARGELVTAEGLAGPDEARRVRAGPDGEPITDGVFPESKEFLAGYWIIDVPDAEHAARIAAAASMAPGPDGKPLHMFIEVRQVMGAPPTE